MKISLDIRNITYIILFILFLILIFLVPFFPEKIVQDSEKVLSTIKNIEIYSPSDSFSMSAYVLNLVSFGKVHFFIFLQGVFYIFLLTRYFVYVRHLFPFLLLLIPNLIFNLLLPGKEVLVISMSIIIVSVIRFSRLKFLPILFIFFLYIPYAYYIRPYYFLIFLFFLFFIYFINIKKKINKLSLLIFLVFLIAMLPSELYTFLFSHRDISNSYALSLGSINRTAFNNLYLPQNFLELIVNYLYVISVIMFPVIYFYTIKDFILLLINLYISVYFLKIYKFKPSYKTKILYSLFYAHLFVLFIFEPDLGSYLRHMSSCSLYLIAYMYSLSQDKDAYI